MTWQAILKMNFVVNWPVFLCLSVGQCDHLLVDCWVDQSTATTRGGTILHKNASQSSTLNNSSLNWIFLIKHLAPLTITVLYALAHFFSYELQSTDSAECILLMWRLSSLKASYGQWVGNCTLADRLFQDDQFGELVAFTAKKAPCSFYWLS